MGGKWGETMGLVILACAGICSESHTLGIRSITSRSSSGKSFGWGEGKRKRTSECAVASREMRSAKRTEPRAAGTLAWKPSRSGRGAAAHANDGCSLSLSALCAYEFTF